MVVPVRRGHPAEGQVGQAAGSPGQNVCDHEARAPDGPCLGVVVVVVVVVVEGRWGDGTALAVVGGRNNDGRRGPAADGRLGRPPDDQGLHLVGAGCWHYVVGCGGGRRGGGGAARVLGEVSLLGRYRGQAGGLNCHRAQGADGFAKLSSSLASPLKQTISTVYRGLSSLSLSLSLSGYFSSARPAPASAAHGLTWLTGSEVLRPRTHTAH